MRITYMEPLLRAWNRMTGVLFFPFNFNKWMVLGFTSFLAGLMDFRNGGGFGGVDDGDVDFSGMAHLPGTIWDWLQMNMLWFVLALFGFLVVLGIIVLLTWLSSRGKFMFLDHVVKDHTRVTEPWHRLKRLGDSLFLWRIGFGLVCLGIGLSLVLLFGLIFYQGQANAIPHYFGFVPGIGLVLVFILLIICVAYITLFVNDFIIPIMYKHDLNILKAWSFFLPIFKTYPFQFILYGLVILLLYLLLGMVIIVGGFFTCCMGFILLAIPYIGSVIFLPFSYVLRTFSLEFLGQMGDEYKILKSSE